MGATPSEDPNVRFRQGLAHFANGNFDRAETEWLAVLASRSPDLAWNLAEIALRRSEWRRGWVLAEARFAREYKPVPRHHGDLAAWQGEALGDTPLLLWGDQGLAEQLLFARFIPDAREHCQNVTIEVAPTLARLFAHAFPGASVRSLNKGNCPPDSRQQCLGSLPRILGLNSGARLGGHLPYLNIPEEALAAWRNRLGVHRLPRVGLAWATGEAPAGDGAHDSEIGMFAPLMALSERCEFHSLQTGPHATDLAGSCFPVVDWSGQITDMLDVASLIAQMDLVIAIDGEVTHLAGALGCQVWSLIPRRHAWYWGDGANDTTPWYSSARLYRQEQPGQWAQPLSAIAHSLGAALPAPLPEMQEYGSAAAESGEEDCLRVLQRAPLNRSALVRLASLASRSPNPRRLLPFLHRGRSLPEPALALSRLLVRIDKKKAALAILRPLTVHQGKSAYAWLLRSDLARQLHLAGEAVACAREAIALCEDDPDAWLHLANAFHEARQATDALAAIRRAASLAPDSPGILNNLGVLLKEQGNLDQAIDAYRRAREVSPGHLAATTNLGSALREKGCFEEALSCYREALNQESGNPDTWFGLGNTLKEMGKTGEAIVAFRQALAINPDHVDVRVNLSLLLLLSGEFAEGWDMYEQRFHRPKNPVQLRRFPQPWWTGDALNGKRLLVWGEQGAGDKIMTYRLLPEILAAGGQVTVETDTRLMRLMEHNFPTVSWVTETTPPNPATQKAALQTPLHSLGRILRRDAASFGDGSAYLQAPPQLVTTWRKRLAHLNGRKIGLVWAGSPTHNNDARRSLRLEQLLPLFAVPHTTFVSLQIGSESGQIAPSGLPVHDFTAAIEDYADTAGLISGLDLVIAVDTSVAHLAAALGVPTWILIPFHPDWRWLECIPCASPWYAAARLFRQPAWNDWASVIATLTEELRRDANPK